MRRRTNISKKSDATASASNSPDIASDALRTVSPLDDDSLIEAEGIDDGARGKGETSCAVRSHLD